MRDQAYGHEEYNDPTPTAEAEDFLDYEDEVPVSIVRMARDPLLTWSEHTGLPQEFWESLGVRAEKDRFVSFNWPNGWKKVRDVSLRVDALSTKDKVKRRFLWINPPPASLRPLWPQPGDSEDHTEIWLTEGESDAAVLRYLGLDAYTYGAATNIPGPIELRQLARLGVKRAVITFDADLPGRTNSKKVESALSTAGIEAINLDLNMILGEFDYAKDVRDLFNKVEGKKCVEMLRGLVKQEMMQQDEELNYKVRLKDAKVPEWVWEGLVAKGSLTLLYGPAKAGKTTLVYQMIRAMRDGGELLTRYMRPQRILYYSEMPQAFDYERVQQYLPQDEEKEFFFVRFAQDEVFKGKTWPAIAMLLQKDVKKYGIDYVILDTANEWLQFEKDDVYSSSAVTEKLRPLRRLSTDFGCTVQINHHPAKSGSSPYGSIAFQAYVDCLLELSRDSDGSELKAVGRIRSDFEGVKFRLEKQEYRVLSVDDQEDVVPSGEGMRERVMQILPLDPESMTVDELMEDAVLKQFSSKSLRNLLQDLMDKGLARKLEGTRPSRWALTFSISVERV